jgi:Fe-S-cluster containining protein
MTDTQRSEVPLLLPARNPCVDQCGGICCAQEAYPPFTPEEANDKEALPLGIRLVLKHMEPLKQTRRQYRAQCYFWSKKTGQCVIYAVRPQACRDFTFNGPSCQQFRRGERFEKPGRATVDDEIKLGVDVVGGQKGRKDGGSNAE